jgi:homoserine kinase
LISSAGSSIFALCKAQNIVDKVAVSMSDAYLDTRISLDIHISKINDQGVKIV